MSFDCSITIPHGMSIAHTMSLNQNIKKIIKELVAKKNHYLRMVQFSEKIYKNNFGTQNFSTRPNLKFTHLLNFCDLVFWIISCMINFDHGL